jgi:hypothetical protein
VLYSFLDVAPTDEGNRQNKTVERKLKWAADGVVVKKTCDVPCYITHDQEQLPKAHGVVMEVSCLL